MRLQDLLKRFGQLSEQETDDISNEINRAISDKKASNAIAKRLGAEYRRPPKIATIGVTGVGKSSTLNALFNPSPSLMVGPAVAITTEPLELSIDLQDRGKIIVVDMPGVGQSKKTEDKYIQLYKDYLSKCDVALWIIKADDRAYKQIQEYILDIVPEEVRGHLVLGVNQVDKMEPGDWVNEFNVPSDTQEINIQEKIQNMRSVFAEVGITPAFIVPYSAKKGYKLAQLFTTLLKACPERAWVLDGRKMISPYQTDLISGSSEEIQGNFDILRQVLLDVGNKLTDFENRLLLLESQMKKTSPKRKATLKKSPLNSKANSLTSAKPKVTVPQKEISAHSAQNIIPSYDLLKNLQINRTLNQSQSIEHKDAIDVSRKLDEIKSLQYSDKQSVVTPPDKERSISIKQDNKATEKPNKEIETRLPPIQESIESPKIDIQISTSPTKSNLSSDEINKYKAKQAEEIISNEKQIKAQEQIAKKSFFEGFKNVVKKMPGLIKKTKEIIGIILDKVIEKVVKALVDKALSST